VPAVQQSINTSWLQGQHQQTCQGGVQQPNDGTDGQRDRWMLDSFIHPVPHTSSVNKNQSIPAVQDDLISSEILKEGDIRPTKVC